MNWLILQLVAMTIGAANGVLDKWLDRRNLNNPRLFLASFAVVSLPVALIGIITHPFITRAALIGLTSGLCFSGAVVLYYRAVAVESIVRLTLPGRLIAVISLPLNALILQERVSAVQVIAFVLMLAGGWLLTVEWGGIGNRRPTRGFWLMLGVEALYMFQDVLKNVLATQYDAWMMLTWERSGIVLGALLVLAHRRDRMELSSTFSRMSGRLRLLLLGKPAAHLIMGLLFGLAVQLAGVATNVIIAGGAYPLIVTALAWLTFNKQPRSRCCRETFIGVLGALVGICLLIF
ncbi:MAG: hypothetical protein BroJett011_41930 [Chloroflexota bacterium]|nr:MAG: hypothetical protein BroJett011_41930 [Chloroflexota bacterium]